jgi:hypothetical protein
MRRILKYLEFIYWFVYVVICIFCNISVEFSLNVDQPQVGDLSPKGCNG